MPLADIHFKHILNYLYINCDYTNKYKNISWNIVEENQDEKWNYQYLSYHKDLNLDFVKNNLKKDWDWRGISSNITLQKLEDNIYLPWDWTYISTISNITIEFIKKYIYKKWNWMYLSMNKAITCNDILNNINLPWNWHYVSKNPNLTIKFIKLFYTKPLNFSYITLNTAITLNDILNNIELNWDWKIISYRFINNIEDINHIKIITSFIDRNNIKLLSLKELSSSNIITIDIVLNNPKIQWNYLMLFENYNFTNSVYDIIIDTLYLKHDFKYIDKNNIFKISNHKIRNYFAVKKIWRYWFRAITNSEYTLCRKRLIKELYNI